jgi:ABC-type branched-subunit amino acid transport system ATPase component
VTTELGVRSVPIVRAAGLDIGYGKVPVVRALDLEVRPGEVVALLGPNGAGKTTTLLALSGDLVPAAGTVFWKGIATKAPLHQRAREGLAYLPEGRSVINSLSTIDNLRLARADVDASFRLFPELADRRRIRAGLLSGGEQQMLALARALARDPVLLLADELSLGLAPLVVNRLLDAVRRAADERGVGVLLVEQHVAKALAYADRVYVMRRGRIAMTGTAAEFSERLHEIEDSYLSARAESGSIDELGDAALG